MRNSKDPYLIEMVSKEFKSDESETNNKKKTKASFSFDAFADMMPHFIEA